MGKPLYHLYQWVRWFCRWLLNPITTTDRSGLDEGRMLLSGWLGVQGWCLTRHFREFMAIGWAAVFMLTVVNLVLLCYCFRDSPEVGQLIMALAGRLGWGGAGPALPMETIQTVQTVQTVGAAPTVDPCPPAADAAGNVRED